MSTVQTFQVDETTLVFAFRYALGRKSTAPSHMVAELKRHWPRLNDWTQIQIKKEIQRAAELYLATSGHMLPCLGTWQEILVLPIKTVAKSGAHD